MNKLQSFYLVLVTSMLSLFGTSAYAVDYTAAATSGTTEINAAITAALPLGILVMASIIGWRLFKRFARG